MHEEAVGVLNLEVVGVGRLDLHDSAPYRVVEDHFERDLQQLVPGLWST